MTTKESKVLVVDDDPSLTELLADTLMTIGYQPFTASSAKEALQVLFKEKIELVISDINMPEMSGIELLQEIKKINQRLPVMLITGIGTDGIKDKAYSNGADGFLAKPFRIGTIESEIGKLLRGVKKRHIVLVDDNEDFLNSLSLRLEATDNIVHAFNTVLGAVEFIEKNKADLVITDLKMPDSDGLALFGMIHDRFPQLPVVMVSAFATSSLLEKIKSSGIKSFMSKPVNFSELEQLLDSYPSGH